MTVQVMIPICPQNWNKADNSPIVIHDNSRALSEWIKDLSSASKRFKNNNTLQKSNWTIQLFP